MNREASFVGCWHQLWRGAKSSVMATTVATTPLLKVEGGGEQVGEHRETVFYNNEKHDNNSGTPVNLGVKKITVIQRSLSWRANSFHSPTNTTLKTSFFLTLVTMPVCCRLINVSETN